ncbi:MAG: hypothetical protein LUP95_04540, partial [Euryarchaeota archaeon]|nr:hypothetical protein [Euryarchaeota archaeon]
MSLKRIPTAIRANRYIPNSLYHHLPEAARHKKLAISAVTNSVMMITGMVRTLTTDLRFLLPPRKYRTTAIIRKMIAS